MSKVNKTTIKKTLSELAFDPTIPPFVFAVQSRNAMYTRIKAQELIAEGNIETAIQFLVLTKLMAPDGTKKAP